jgi:hypothetical protein
MTPEYHASAGSWKDVIWGVLVCIQVVRVKVAEKRWRETLTIPSFSCAIAPISIIRGFSSS